MNQRYVRKRVYLANSGSHPLIFLCISFLLGIISGCALASFSQKESPAHLFSYLDGYFSVLESGGYSKASLLSTFWEIARWPLFAGLMGTTLFGVIALPALLCLRGFLLSYAISVLVCLYGGWRGLLLAFVVFGIPALCSVISLFIIGWNVLHHHHELRKNRSKAAFTTQNQQLILSLFAVILWTFFGTVAQHWITPVLLNRLASMM